LRTRASLTGGEKNRPENSLSAWLSCSLASKKGGEEGIKMHFVRHRKGRGTTGEYYKKKHIFRRHGKTEPDARAEKGFTTRGGGLNERRVYICDRDSMTRDGSSANALSSSGEEGIDCNRLRRGREKKKEGIVISRSFRNLKRTSAARNLFAEEGSEDLTKKRAGRENR